MENNYAEIKEELSKRYKCPIWIDGNRELVPLGLMSKRHHDNVLAYLGREKTKMETVIEKLAILTPEQDDIRERLHDVFMLLEPGIKLTTPLSNFDSFVMGTIVEGLLNGCVDHLLWCNNWIGLFDAWDTGRYQYGANDPPPGDIEEDWSKYVVDLKE